MNACRRHRPLFNGPLLEVTLLVAWMLVVQTFFAGLSLGQMAEASERLPGILCSGNGGVAPVDPFERPATQSHNADCCMLGCPMAAAPPSRVASAIDRGFAAAFSHSGDPAGLDGPPRRAELMPLHSRAPPFVLAS